MFFFWLINIGKLCWGHILKQRVAKERLVLEPEYMIFEEGPEHMMLGEEPAHIKFGLGPEHIKFGLEPEHIMFGLEPEHMKFGLGPGHNLFGLEPGHKLFGQGPIERLFVLVFQLVDGQPVFQQPGIQFSRRLFLGEHIQLVFPG
jgi:hypothetical protein